MLKKYHEYYTVTRAQISGRNISYYTNYDLRHWMYVTGFFLPNLPHYYIQLSSFTISGTYPLIDIVIDDTNLYFNATFNIQSKSIYVSYFILREKGKGYGRKILDHFLNATLQMGFLVIRCRATSGEITLENKKVNDGRPIHLNGSEAWGKMGFTMTVRSHVEFLQKIKRHDRKEKCLQELLKTEDGIRFWKEHINMWNAEFYLREGSLNWEIIEEINTLRLDNNNSRI